MNSFTAWSNLDRAYQSSDNFNPAFIYAIAFHTSSSLCVRVCVPFFIHRDATKRVGKYFYPFYLKNRISHEFKRALSKYLSLAIYKSFVKFYLCPLKTADFPSRTTPVTFESDGCFVSRMTITDSKKRKSERRVSPASLQTFVFRITECFRKRQLSLLIDQFLIDQFRISSGVFRERVLRRSFICTDKKVHSFRK